MHFAVFGLARKLLFVPGLALALDFTPFSRTVASRDNSHPPSFHRVVCVLSAESSSTARPPFPIFCFLCIHHFGASFSLYVIDYTDSEESSRQASGKGGRSSNDSDSDVPSQTIVSRKRKRRLVLSSDDEGTPQAVPSDGSTFSGELTPSPARSDIENVEHDSFEELSEGEERRRRLGKKRDEIDFRYVDPELYGLRRSSRRAGQSTRYQQVYSLIYSRVSSHGS